jgi:hypothetical protein
MVRPDPLGPSRCLAWRARQRFTNVVSVGEGLVPAVVDSEQKRDALNGEGNTLEEFRTRSTIVRIHANSAGKT